MGMLRDSDDRLTANPRRLAVEPLHSNFYSIKAVVEASSSTPPLRLSAGKVGGDRRCVCFACLVCVVWGASAAVPSPLCVRILSATLFENRPLGLIEERKG